MVTISVKLSFVSVSLSNVFTLAQIQCLASVLRSFACFGCIAVSLLTPTLMFISTLAMVRETRDVTAKVGYWVMFGERNDRWTFAIKTYVIRDVRANMNIVFGFRCDIFCY